MRPFSNVLSRLAASCGLVAALAGIGLPASAADSPAFTAPYAVDDFVADRPQVEWAEAYLQWIASFSRASSPISDTSGSLCAARQDGDVWFLAMSDGTAPVERACSIPPGKTLFVPIASTLERSGNKEPDCDSMARIAASTLSQHVSQMTLAIDGQAVEDLASHRLATNACFALGLRQLPRQGALTTVADGYYVMLRPLAPGAHTIVVGARFDSASLSTTYRLDVH